ncbi:hemerythrin domain-containing protein [Devosia sp. FKR38]|uniref:hemerythrin domain-containing protein n=1 Tax=Devosia sp. FKR38 TaxID=2562312 RepID=UPI0010C0967C|nr:hemerythrin domain-containing protein [Devosia sp. FKR38]
MKPASPLNRLRSRYEDLLGVCDELEAFADGLPGVVPATLCAQLIRRLADALSATHREEEAVLLPVLSSSTQVGLRNVATRLRQEHVFDSQVVMEIEESLLDWVAGAPGLSPDAIGYLLRSFFESVRRHVRSEQDLLLLLFEGMPPAGVLH